MLALYRWKTHEAATIDSNASQVNRIHSFLLFAHAEHTDDRNRRNIFSCWNFRRRFFVDLIHSINATNTVGVCWLHFLDFIWIANGLEIKTCSLRDNRKLSGLFCTFFGKGRGPGGTSPLTVYSKSTTAPSSTRGTDSSSSFLNYDTRLESIFSAWTPSALHNLLAQNRITIRIWSLMCTINIPMVKLTSSPSSSSFSSLPLPRCEIAACKIVLERISISNNGRLFIFRIRI